MNDIRILVVDDEIKLVETMVERLQTRGFLVAGMSNGKDALRYLEGNAVDVVVLDVMMKDLNGLEVLKEIKAGWPLVQTIMLTGHASVRSGMTGLRLGAFDYLIKPVPLDALIRKINQAAERKIALSAATHPGES
jgi:two-component system, OmpR family, response regulator